MFIEKSIKKHLEKLEKFTATPNNGVTRFPFTKEAHDCVDYIKKAMKNAGLSVSVDGSGAVIGRLEKNTAKTIIIGSHYDTVKNGGAYDGIAGVVCGIVLAEYLTTNNIEPRCSLEIIATNDEEGARFKGGFHSSNAMLGNLKKEDFAKSTDANGISILDAMQEWGISMEDLDKCKRDISKIEAFLEVHIEQGPVLEECKKEIGIVDNIVGMQRYICEVYGRADHAGTTPMGMRKDALSAVAKVVSEVEDYALEEENSVATVGYLNVYPNEINVIAQNVKFTVDIRSVDIKKIERIFAKILNKLELVCKKSELEFTVKNTLSVEPTKMNANLKELIKKSCEENQFSYMELNSGAGHDSLPIGKVIPTAMIFIPTKNGRSHCPIEFCKYSDLAKSVKILYDLVK